MALPIERKFLKLQEFCATKCIICLHNTIRKNDKLYPCKQCKLIYYCGQEHQKLDWKTHRKFCKAIAELMNECEISYIFKLNCDNSDNSTLANFQSTILYIKMRLQLTLGRDLYPEEQQLIHFPRLCNICLEYRSEYLQTCENCKAVSYCSESHSTHFEQSKQKHLPNCETFRLHYNYTIESYPSFPLSATLINKLREKQFPKDLLTLLNEISDREIKGNPVTNMDYNYFGSACNYTFILSIIAVIMKTNLTTGNVLRSHGYDKILTIDIIGATNEYEFFTDIECPLFFIWLPHLQEIHINFIGLELIKMSPNTDDTTETADRKIYELNHLFHNKEKIVKLSTYKSSYESYVGCKVGHHPNLIVCFNCGFSEELHSQESDNSWKSALDLITHSFSNLPIAFTSYTKQESKNDTVMFIDSTKKLQREFSIVCLEQENPFKDLRPIRNWEIVDVDNIFFYRNNYLTIIKLHKLD